MSETIPGSQIKRKLAAGEVVFGVTINFLDAALAEFLGRLGFDCVVVDAEHGVLTDGDLQTVAMGCELAGCGLLLRIIADDPLLQRYMALGVTGVQLPMVRSAAQVRKVVDAIKFPPRGHRGVGLSRESRFGFYKGGFPALMEASNQRTVLMVQIEDREGVAALPEIVQIEDVDAVLIGLADLSSDLGVPGQVDHPEVVAALERIVRVAGAAGKPIGLGAYTPADVEKSVKRGARYLLTSVSRAIALGASGLLQAASAGSAASAPKPKS